VITGAKCSNLLRLEPPPLNNSRYVIRVDRKFRISCICQQTSVNCLHLTWRNEFGRKIDGESSNSLFTVELREHESMYRKLSLVFTQIAKRDTGFYRCVARSSRRMSADWKVELIVVDEIRWKESNDVVGGMFGESLTIDCGSIGNPQPETHITNHNGFPLNETLFVIAGSEVTVNKLTNEYQDTIIKCLSVQEFEKYDATVVEQHEIRLDVIFRLKRIILASPEFSKPFVERFIVLDHLAQICCNVTRSNPPATHFRYLKGSTEIGNDSNHIISTDALNQSSCLMIFSPTEYDLGEYQCEVSNGKSKSLQTIAVKEASPPGEVHVSLQDIGMTYVVWKIEEGFGEQLPIQRYIIEYIKKSILEQSRDQTRENNRVWFAYAVKMDVHLSKDGLYEVGGLRQGTTYIFRFTAENEAGIGDAVTLAVKTTSRIKSSKLTRSASTPLQHFTLNIAFFLHFFQIWEF
uniref:Ig-like domain-containing protein n=1 Tax=Elaeophora elaphi TaxID=1147741 RepID=A0A0R3S343_9BILA